jgi:GGDEF domain-containing protein
VLWSALRAELRDPEPEFVYALAERLSAVTELVRAAALRSLADRTPGARTRLRAAPPVSGGSFDPEPVGPPEPPAVAGEPQTVAAEPAPPASEPPAPAAPPPPAQEAREPVAQPNPGRDDALWVAALEDEIVRSRRSGAPLSLLLAELDESARLVAAQRPERPPAAFGRFAQAVRGVLRRQDLLASEDAARTWVIARDTTRPGAAALADRVTAAVAALEPVHGAPLTVSVGIAVLDEDAHDAPSLLEAAEEACFSAAASGAAVAGAADPADPA